MSLPKIYLASSSPRRHEILRRVGIAFEPVPREHFDENDLPHIAPEDYARRLAEMKLEKAILPEDADGIVIAFDTIVFVDGQILGKPKDADEAKRFLRKLSGRWHTVFTAVCAMKIPEKTSASKVERTDVLFSELTDEEIDLYIASGEPMDKAGAYGIQELGAFLVKRVDGCFYNVVGLPLLCLTEVLSCFNIKRIDIFNRWISGEG